MQNEIDWADHPAPVAAGSKPDLIRCGLGSLPPLIALNQRHVGSELHFWQGRSFPHLKHGCPACAAKNVATWKGYIGVWNPSTRLCGILEFTLGCVSALDAYFLAHGTCRGASIILKRTGQKANGKLIMGVTPSQWGHDQLPPIPAIKAQLEMMWGSKRLDEFISTNPHRPVVEAPTNTNEVLARRNIGAVVGDQIEGDEPTMPISTVGQLLAARFSVPSNGTPKGTP